MFSNAELFNFKESLNGFQWLRLFLDAANGCGNVFVEMLVRNFVGYTHKRCAGIVVGIAGPKTAAFG